MRITTRLPNFTQAEYEQARAVNILDYLRPGFRQLGVMKRPLKPLDKPFMLSNLMRVVVVCGCNLTNLY